MTRAKKRLTIVTDMTPDEIVRIKSSQKRMTNLTDLIKTFAKQNS